MGIQKYDVQLLSSAQQSIEDSISQFQLISKLDIKDKIVLEKVLEIFLKALIIIEEKKQSLESLRSDFESVGKSEDIQELFKKFRSFGKKLNEGLFNMKTSVKVLNTRLEALLQTQHKNATDLLNLTKELNNLKILNEDLEQRLRREKQKQLQSDVSDQESSTYKILEERDTSAEINLINSFISRLNEFKAKVSDAFSKVMDIESPDSEEALSEFSKKAEKSLEGEKLSDLVELIKSCTKSNNLKQAIIRIKDYNTYQEIIDLVSGDKSVPETLSSLKLVNETLNENGVLNIISKLYNSKEEVLKDISPLKQPIHVKEYVEENILGKLILFSSLSLILGIVIGCLLTTSYKNRILKSNKCKENKK